MKLVWKKIFTDPAFWILFLVNLYLIYKYEHSPQIFTTLIWLYYSQNLLLGFFNFLDMATVRKVAVPDIDPGIGNKKQGKFPALSSAWSFLLMFGFFHFVYFIFLITMKRSGPFDWLFYKNFLLVFLMFQILNFIQHKIWYKKNPPKITQMTIVPFLRIVPMHLCILIPGFFNISNLTVFLVLKVIADVLTYVVTNSYYKSNPLLTFTGLNINSTISEV